MSFEPDSTVWHRWYEDTDDDTEDRKEEKPEQPTVFKFTENEDSILFRKFLRKWEATWHKQKGTIRLEREKVGMESRKEKRKYGGTSK